MQNITLQSLGMRRNQNFEMVFGFKIGTAVLTSIFRFLPFLLFSFFLPHFVFFCWTFSRLHFGGKSLLESFKDFTTQHVGLDERKVMWVQWYKIFVEIFISMLHGLLPFSLVLLTELCSFSYGLKDLFTLHKLTDKVVLDH